MNNLRFAAIVVAAALAGVILYRVSTIQPRPQSAQASTELLSRVVTTCDQLNHEINEMTQVTAEIRKVLGDMAHLTCTLPSSLGPSTGPKPDCSPGEAVPYYGTWTCVSVPK